MPISTVLSGFELFSRWLHLHFFTDRCMTEKLQTNVASSSSVHQLLKHTIKCVHLYVGTL